MATIRHSARVNIFGRPSMRRMPNRTAVAGESISIICPVGGYPIDLIIWERGIVNIVNINNVLFANKINKSKMELFS